jgi:NAD-dependent SIR2 family protein deacetylase
MRGPEQGIDRLVEFIQHQAPLFVLSGAGCSTDSGIPDYRDGDGRWKRAEPIRYQAFLRDERARRRYWARSFVGWPRVADARPNRAHLALAALERGGLLAQLVTQNVDGLHQRGGSRRVIDLHGRLDLVDCLACGLRLSRSRLCRDPDGGIEATGSALTAGKDFAVYELLRAALLLTTRHYPMRLMVKSWPDEAIIRYAATRDFRPETEVSSS